MVRSDWECTKHSGRPRLRHIWGGAITWLMYYKPSKAVFALHASCAMYYKMFHFPYIAAWQGDPLRVPAASPRLVACASA